MPHTKKIIFLALLTAQGLVLFLLEGLIPFPFLAPGAKLGLANIITLLALYTLKPKEALAVLLLRILLGSLFGGGLTVLLYSLAGGICSWSLMLALKNTNHFSLIGVSCAGGFAHHIGQLIVACAVMNTSSLWLYLPILGPCGIVTGFLLGYLCRHILKILRTSTQFFK